MSPPPQGSFEGAGSIEAKRRARPERGRSGATARPLWEPCNGLPGFRSRIAARFERARHAQPVHGQSGAIVRLRRLPWLLPEGRFFENTPGDLFDTMADHKPRRILTSSNRRGRKGSTR